MEMDRSTAPPLRTGWRDWPTFGGVAGAALFVSVAVLFCQALGDRLPGASLPLIFLAPVLFSASRFGLWTGFLAALFAFVGYNYFFVEPRRTFFVARPEDALALAIFLLVAAVTGLLAGRMREEADAARGRADVLEMLSAFSADLSAATCVEAIETLVLRHVARAVGGAAILFKSEGGGLSLVNRTDSAPALAAADLMAAEWVYRHGQPLAATKAGWSGSRFAFHPIKRGETVAAVYGVAIGEAWAKEREQAVEAMLRQGEIAIERMTFAREAEHARAAAEQERIRSTLISSISHDLRTPLATIMGSVTSLRELGNVMPPEVRSDLLIAIEEETGRLSRFVSNLLAMTQLESGLAIRGEWIDAADVANAAVKRARQSFPAATIFIDVAPARAVINADAVLLEQALFNLIDNAVKFSAPDQPVRVAVSSAPGVVEFSVLDEGPGIPLSDIDRVFEKFFRVEGAGRAGTGLGLTICRSVVTALGGKIHAESPVMKGRGARVRIVMPAGETRW